jgi:hypothetical protein
MDKLVEPRVDVYTVIANHWDIPRHRVKHLFYMGAYGMAGSEKSVEEWIDQLDKWDEAYHEGLIREAKAGAESAKPRRIGRFSSAFNAFLRNKRR